MLYVFYGTNTEKVGKKIQATLNSLFNKKPDASFFKIDAEHWSREQCEELIGGQGLFERKYIILLDSVLSQSEDAQEFIMSILDEIVEAPHVFLMREESLNAQTRKKMEKAGVHMQEISSPKKQKAAKMSVFEIADGFVARSKKKAWTSFIHMRDFAAPEEIHGTLFFQAKALLLAKKSRSAEEAGLTPFPFKKARQHAHRFTENELKRILQDLIVLYHESHRGISDLDIGLEQFLLESTSAH